MVTSTDRPTNQPTNQQGEYRAICFFRKLENRKKAEICNLVTFIRARLTPPPDHGSFLGQIFNPYPFENWS